MLQRILPDLEYHGSDSGTTLNQKLHDMLEEYATEGLRTLVVSKRCLSEEEWREWDGVWKAASTALSGREEALMDAAEQIEKDMMPLGITAIEDKLQVRSRVIFCMGNRSD